MTIATGFKTREKQFQTIFSKEENLVFKLEFF